MQQGSAKFSTRAIKASLWLGTALLAFALFIKITSELLEHEVSSVDRTILVGVAKARIPWLTMVAVDLTALGSVTLVVLISTMSLCVLLLFKDRMGALQLLATSVGAGIFTTTIKDYIDRARPEVITRLVEVSGLSYPSGHSVAATSLYLTVAIVVSRHLQRTGHQIAILAMTVGIILLVGMTRIYLGVHYPSDVASGISLGAAWARSSLIPRSTAAGNSSLDRAPASFITSRSQLSVTLKLTEVFEIMSEIAAMLADVVDQGPSAIAGRLA